MKVNVLSDEAISTNSANPDGWSCAYPQTVINARGSVFCLYRRGSAKHGPDGTLVLQRSDDNGQIWNAPQTVFDRTREDPPWTVISAGLCADGDALVASFNTVRMLERDVYVFSPEAAAFPARVNVMRSADGGVTWSDPARVATPDFAAKAGVASSPFMLDDGALCVPLEVTLPNSAQGTAAVYSHDGGRTFVSPRLIASDAAGELSVGDARFTKLSDGTHLVHLWAFRVDTELTVNVHASRSAGGRDWTPTEPTSITGQISQPLQLADGKVVTICNHRQTPAGSQLWWSRDAGHTWNDRPVQMWDAAQGRIVGAPAPPRADTEPENVWKALPQFAFGTPNLLQTPDGIILLTYWAALNDVPHIRVCRFRLIDD